MVQGKAGSTDSRLLSRVAALRNNSAWDEFFETYEPLVRRWCSVYRIDAASLDEVCQRVWVELVRRMPTYVYNPRGSFSGWLRRLCYHRAIDFYRERRRCPDCALNEEEPIDECWMAFARSGCERTDGESSPERQVLLREAQEVRVEVQRKVKPVRWQVFWRVVIEGEPMSEAAAALGLKYATAYAAAKHVAEMLKAEGRLRSERLGLARHPVNQD